MYYTVYNITHILCITHTLFVLCMTQQAVLSFSSSITQNTALYTIVEAGHSSPGVQLHPRSNSYTEMQSALGPGQGVKWLEQRPGLDHCRCHSKLVVQNNTAQTASSYSLISGSLYCALKLIDLVSFIHCQ